MARIRTIKPEFPQSESMGAVSRDARLTFVMMWTIADDSGRIRGNSRMLASLLHPYDDDAPALMPGWLDELEHVGCIVRYQADGGSFIAIRNWDAHQKIDRPTPSKFPAPPSEEAPKSTSAAEAAPVDSPLPREDSRGLANDREPSSLDLDQGPKDQGPKDHKPGASARPDTPRALTADELVADGLTAETAAEFLSLRRKRRAPLTPRAWEGIRLEVEAAPGWTLEEAICKALSRGWQSVEAAWLHREQPDGKPQAESFRERDRRLAAEKVAAWTGGLAHDRKAVTTAPSAPPAPFDVIEEPTHGRPRLPA